MDPTSPSIDDAGEPVGGPERVPSTLVPSVKPLELAALLPKETKADSTYVIVAATDASVVDVSGFDHVVAVADPAEVRSVETVSASMSVAVLIDLPPRLLRGVRMQHLADAVDVVVLVSSEGDRPFTKAIKHLQDAGMAQVGLRRAQVAGGRETVTLVREFRSDARSGSDELARARRDLDALMRQIEGCPPEFRPTNFWGPGVDQLLDDVATMGFDRFKSWPSATFWFYPTYGDGFRYATIGVVYESVKEVNPSISLPRLRSVLGGSQEARRDLHAVQLAWNHDRWPFDLDDFGESNYASPPQRYPLMQTAVGWTRPYLNYLLCLTALSNHVDSPPRSFLEIGGGFGVLGEILHARDAEVRYVDCDIPPLISVAAHYLQQVTSVPVAAPSELPEGEVVIDGLGCLPSWRLPDLRGDFDVFVNSYSFQEMEPDVVANYIRLVAQGGVRYVVSLNSRAGKRRAEEGKAGGAIDPVTSEFIVERFGEYGFEVAGRYGEPLLVSAGELVVLRRR